MTKPIQEHQTAEFIGLIYDAALSPARWQPVLDHIAGWSGGKVSLALHDQKSGRPAFLATANWEEDWVASYVSYYAPINPWTANLQNIPSGTAAPDEIMFPKAALRKTEFHEDWLRPQALVSATAAVVFNDAHRFLNISVMHETEHFQDECVRRFEIVIPHLQRVAQIQRQLSGLSAKAQSFERAFDRLDRGVVLLDGDGRAFFFNQRARGYFERGQGLSLGQGGQVQFARRDVHDKLLKAIFKAAQTAKGAGQSAGEIIAVPRPLGMTPWSVMVAPIPASALDFGRPEGAVALFIVDPDQRPVLSVAALRAVLELTAAEARVAIALADGNAPEEIAAKLGLSTLTVRTHLRNAMGKTGTSRLPELVALVLRAGGAVLS